MHNNSPFPHLMLNAGHAAIAPDLAAVLEEGATAAMLGLITSGLYEEVIERETWLTAQDLIDASKRTEPDRSEDLQMLIDQMSSESGEPIDAQVLGRWLETVKGIECEELVLARSQETPTCWGVLYSGGDVVIEISEEADPDSVLAALEVMEAESRRPSEGSP